jgi:metal-responsive CopG/Arc/MetJ family transcriptional regulator
MAKSVKLNSDLWKRVEQHASAAGYSSPEEFVEHLIEEELTRRESPEAVEAAQEAERRLRGLGYLE